MCRIRVGRWDQDRGRPNRLDNCLRALSVGDPRKVAGNGAEFVAVDRDGNLYAGSPAPEVAEIRQGSNRRLVRPLPIH